MALLSPLFTRVFPAVDLFKSPIYFTFGGSIIRFLPMSLVLDSKNPFDSFIKPAVFCKGFIFFKLSPVLSRLMFSLRFEPGRAFMSGKNDYDDFMKDYVVFSVISDFIYVFDSFMFFTSEEFLFASFDKSKPPPVWSYLRALLSSAYLNLASYCSFMYFLSAYSALFWVYFLLSYSYCYFLSFYSSSLFFYYSALLRRSYYLAFFSARFFYVYSLSLRDFSIKIWSE